MSRRPPRRLSGMTMIDLGPACRRLAALVEAIPDERLGDPTPCPPSTLADLLDHVSGLSHAFTLAARKDLTEPMLHQPPPPPDGGRLGPGWRSRIAAQLEELAAAWRDPDAWTGTTKAGGVDLPGEVAGLVALDEVVLHGWDVARASGQPFTCDEASLEAIEQFLAPSAEPGNEAEREGLFGPVVPVPPGASRLDRVLGMAGRDPAWPG